MTRREIVDYAEANNLVIWSKECSDSAMKSLEKLDRIERIIHDVTHREVASARPYFGAIQEIRKVLSDGQ